MTRRKASKKLNTVDAQIHVLERELRALERQAFGSEIPEAERRVRYFSIGDIGLRRKLMGVARSLHELRQQQRAATVEYWTTVATETRAKLADLTSESPASAWRRDIWWDVLTILWILGGAGWLVYRIPGAAAGTAATAAAAWFIVRSRARGRLNYIRQGEELLRSSERELHAAERAAGPGTQAAAVFSETEARTGTPDVTG